MVQAMINISEKANKILNIIKAMYDLKDKSQAIEFVAKWYRENRLEPALTQELTTKVTKPTSKK